MKVTFFFFIIISLFFFEENKKSNNVDKNFSIIKFNSSPISIKKITLDIKKYWVTSSMSGNKKKDTICKYKDYWLKRTYHVISKEKVNQPNHNKIKVFVKNDENKWNGEKAVEKFKSIYVEDDSIKLWDVFSVGMPKKKLISMIKIEKYHDEYEKVVMYSENFESTFFIDRDTVKQIEVKRRCK